MMTTICRAIVNFALFVALCYFAGYAVQAQDFGQDSTQSLGDVVRHQQEARRKKAKRVINDEDLAGARRRQVTGYAAGTVIIPAIRITGIVPDGVSMSVPPDLKQKMIVSFGPSLDSCFDVICAESTYLHLFSSSFGGTPSVLFEADESIQGKLARVAHLEIIHDERGKMLATVAFIQTPASIATASCIYKASDAPDVETDCEAFIASLEIHVPERYIYVQHRDY